MFTSKSLIAKKTGKYDLPRDQFIAKLHSDFNDNIESSKQGTNYHTEQKLAKLCHLANFAYDPVNFDIFDKLGLCDFFIAQSQIKDYSEFAMSGLSNLCSGNNYTSNVSIDKRFASQISENIEILPQCQIKLSIIYQCMLVLEDKSRVIEYVEEQKFVKDKQNQVILTLIEEEILRQQIKQSNLSM